MDFKNQPQRIEKGKIHLKSFDSKTNIGIDHGVSLNQQNDAYEVVSLRWLIKGGYMSVFLWSHDLIK